MLSVREALSEIRSIRGQMARSIEFRGYGPITLASTGLLAILIASMQNLWAIDVEHEPARFLAMWIGAAAVSLTFISIETVARARRIHSVLATQMMHSATEQLMPPIVSGLLLTVVLAHAAPQSLWMLPGLWQILFSLGVFASCRFLPRGTFWVGVWYLATGTGCLALGRDVRACAWEMGIPFGVGHLMVAGVLQCRYRRSNDESQA
jgi:hypothetical protein